MPSSQTGSWDVSHTDIRWIWAGPNPATGDDTYIGSTDSGTCTVAKVVGRTFGSAKRASITLVRFSDRDKRYSVENWIDSLLRIYDDIRTKGLRNRAAVLMTWHFEVDQDSTPYLNAVINAFTVLIRELTAFGVVFVTSSGDKGLSTLIKTFPPLLATDIPGLIVVGGVDILGAQSQRAQTAPFVKVAAISVDWLCPAKDGGRDYAQGTSGAAAVVAGLVANFLTLGTPAREIPEKIFRLAYPRLSGDPPVAWNGIDFRLLNNGLSRNASQAQDSSGGALNQS